MRWRLKLLLAAAAAVLIAGGTLLVVLPSPMQAELVRQARAQALQYGELAAATLAAPLQAGDGPALQQVLQRLQRADGARYLVLLDGQGRAVAAAGWNLQQPLPAVDADRGPLPTQGAEPTLHAQRPLVVDGRPLGELRYGVSTAPLAAVGQDLLLRRLAGGGLLLLGSALLALALRDLRRHRRQRNEAAEHDPLTGLLNRRGLHHALGAAVAEGGHRGRPLALLFVDLDDFKYANDTFGHGVGDDVLRRVAQALAAELQPGERVARIGGDEFALLCPGRDAAAAARLAPRLVQVMSRLPVDARGHELRLGCSVGVAVFPDDAPSADALMVCADLAMFDAKRVGKNGWAAYRHDAERTLSESAHLRWNARLTRAIDEQRFCLQFQAVHHADGAGVAHYEALLRLPDEGDDGTLVAPGEFVPHAERSGRIRPIDRWVLTACIRALALAPDGVRVAANLSARSISDRSLPGHVQALLAEHGVDGRRLLIELTETSTLDDPRAAGEMIARLRALGCSVHLDDFGAGFASFAHLKLLPVDGIKIDGSYVRGLAHQHENRALVSAMVAMARALGMTTVAEHVEDEPTLHALRALGVDLVQGFFFDHPRSVDLAAVSPVAA
ncbi:MAG: bifunctional diguanylate cyclase/phosphodiesterase [Rubrivivax sp.]|jgi:diguanylate cyclase (GGDEF)-like protein|nr:bifunctional diguanylate cyclase/phosphodiesterase [Rubrivivax sp.]